MRRASDLLSNGVSIDDLALDNDGSLECEEVRHVLSAGAQGGLAKFDEDGEGTVTLDEARASGDPIGERGRGRAKRAAKGRADVERGRGGSEQCGRSGDREPDKAKGKSRKDG